MGLEHLHGVTFVRDTCTEFDHLPDKIKWVKDRFSNKRTDFVNQVWLISRAVKKNSFFFDYSSL